ncbi:MAG TPA: pyrrolo-quinoline quinone [Burkholderiaceae bacterium]|nr:pyrrolo-quinoline quinone [Burkholderiaceae bacterium]
MLTPANVGMQTFGKVAFFAVDGKVDAQPLYLSNVNIPGVGTRNVLYAVTEHASAYAFDADSGTELWQKSMLGTGETPAQSDSLHLNCSQVAPEIGITATPVIDRTRGPNGALYLIAMSFDSSGNYIQRVHALDVATGAELFGGPQTIAASYPGTGANSSNGRVVFDPGQYEERVGLLMLNGVLYSAWTSHCDFDPYTGWVIGIDARTLQQASVFNVTPNGAKGAIWMAGSGLAADSSGAIYFIAGNGTFDESATGIPADLGNAFLKLSTQGGLAVADFFASYDTTALSDIDEDFGSGGALLFPDLVDAGGNTRHLAVGAGKDAKIYVVDRDSMGGFSSSGNNNYQVLVSSLGGSVFSKPAYFNGALYYGAVGDNIKAFPVVSALVSATPSSRTATTFAYPGATPSISSNGNTKGIVWAVENNSTAVLHAYDASNLAREFYNSNQAANGRDQFGAGNKFIAPVIVNGRVYVGTPDGVAAFGLLP